MSFVHLHVRSEYSLLESALRLRELIRAAREYKMPALALTDHMNMSGAVRFYDGCMEAGVLPILGVEAEFEPFAANLWREEVLEGNPPESFPAVLLARNNEGYKRLCRLLSRSYEEAGETGRPRFKWEWFDNEGDLVFLTGGSEGELARLLAKDKKAEAAEYLVSCLKTFGRENVFLELQWHGREEEKALVTSQIELAEPLGIKLAAANECKYLRKGDAGVLGLLEAIKEGRTVDDPKELTPECDQYYFRSPEEMRQIFKNHPEACDNTLLIAQGCNVEINPEKRTELPRFPLPAGLGSDEALEEKAKAGLLKLFPELRGGEGELAEKLRGRLDYELDIIERLGFSDYFLIVADYVNFAKKAGIPVGPGRGSAVGSLVAYALGITEIDPVKYDLFFERFLNPSRRKMPDIDIDFCERRRGEVIDYIRERFGLDFCAQVATFSTLRAKAALQDCARVLKTPEEIVARAGAVIEGFAREKDLKAGVIGEARKFSPALRNQLAEAKDKSLSTLLYAAEKIEDMPRNVSLHAAAVVISPEPLRDRIPLFGSGNDTRTQCDMYAVERVGLLKMDVLGLRTLTIMEDMRLIAEAAGLSIDLKNVPLDDPEAFALVSRGATIGIFQLESEGMKRVLRRLRPNSFRDIIAVLALYRPGPMQYIDSFIRRHNGEEEITYAHPKLAKILKETYGIMLYQEQVMQALHQILGYTLSNADLFRQIMSKKKVAQMEKERARFLEHARAKKIPPETAEKLYNDIASFAGYGFNKSHAAAYALIAYRMAYLKAKYPAVFCAGLLNAHIGDADFTARLLREMKGALYICRPDINTSEAAHSAFRDGDEFKLRFGLTGVRGVGEKLAEAIVEERKKGEYSSLDNFCLRLPRRLLQPQAVENLIKAGCFDSVCPNRREALLLANDLVSGWDGKSESSLQRSFFSTRGGGQGEGDFSEAEKLACEKEALGLYVTGHPLDVWRSFWEKKVTLRSSELKATSLENPGRAVVMGGLVNYKRKRFNRRGEPYLVLKLEDLEGEFEVVLWEPLCSEMERKINVSEVWFLLGTVRESRGNGEPSVWAEKLKRFTPQGEEIKG